MNYRKLGKTGFEVSEISLGTWQLGGKWGSPFSSDSAREVLTAAVENGINFFDTADVYSDGNSEKAIGKFLKERSEKIYVATKCGRKLDPHRNVSYTTNALRLFVEKSLKNMQLETIDLIQLHCPPTEVYYRPEIFELFDRLKDEGKILNMGVSVERVEEAIKAIEYPNVTTVQIIYNIFRQRPAELFFDLAKKKDVGILVRVPLASGLLTGKYTMETQFSKGDHRNFNREGQYFDKGETFSGVDYETGLAAVEKLRPIFKDPENMAPAALKWILMDPRISCIIPGASRADQALSNVRAADMPDLSETQMQQIKAVYDSDIKPLIHHIWSKLH
jgi:aryl-alcohol dehydrogenase-like predicted oxidoreductase